MLPIYVTIWYSITIDYLMCMEVDTYDEWLSIIFNDPINSNLLPICSATLYSATQLPVHLSRLRPNLRDFPSFQKFPKAQMYITNKKLNTKSITNILNVFNRMTEILILTARYRSKYTSMYFEQLRQPHQFFENLEHSHLLRKKNQFTCSHVPPLMTVDDAGHCFSWSG